MIWARPLSSSDGGLEQAIRRAGLPPEADAALDARRSRWCLVTGLDARARATLEGAAGDQAAGGAVADSLILSLSREDLARWAAGPLGAASDLVAALGRLFAADTPPAPTDIGPRRFEWGRRTYVMGVLNVTPDSFSDGGRYQGVDAAVAQAEALAEAGADLLDIGGESTRPGAEVVPESEELARVVPVIQAVARRLPAMPLSVDTAKAGVAARALEAGAHLVNDVGGLQSPALLAAASAAGAPVCTMHMQGSPRTMQVAPRYEDVVDEVLDFLEASVRRAEAAGIARNRVLVDPGIGFGKRLEHNLFLLRHLEALRLLGAPVLVGHSRKAFLGALTGKPAGARDLATAASASAIAVARGADVVRVHDVARTVDAVRVADAIARAAGGGARYGGESLEHVA